MYGVGTNGFYQVGSNIWAGLMTPPKGLTNTLGAAASRRHALAIKPDGTVATWGDVVGAVPSTVSNVIQVAGNWNDSVVLRADGKVLAWGYDTGDVPHELTNAVQVVADLNYAMALRRDGSTRSWGWLVPTNWPAVVTNVVEIAARGANAVMLRPDGTVLAYGTTPPADLTNAVAVAAGLTYSMALRSDGTVTAWGEGSTGQADVPASATNITFIAAGFDASAAINAEGKVITWGSPYFASIVAHLNDASSISLSQTFAVGLRGAGAPTFTTPFADRVVSAGLPAYFRAHATGSRPMSYQWRMHGTNLPGATNAILVLTEPRLVDSGLYSVVASNELGTATSPEMHLQVAPLQIASGPAWTSILLGTSGALSVAAQGRGPFTYQWMLSGTPLPSETNATLTFTNVQKGQTGIYSVTVSNGFGTVTTTPVLMSVSLVAEYGGAVMFPPGFGLPPRTNTSLSLHDVVAISASGGFTSPGHTLALTSQGQVLAWGTEPSATNVPPAATNIIAIAAGEGRSLALNEEGRIFAWYWSTEPDEFAPTLSNVVAIAAGEHCVALMSDGVAVVWGGLWPPTQPEPPLWFSNVVAISAYALIYGDGRVTGWDPFFSPKSVSNATMIASCETRGLVMLEDGGVFHLGSGFALAPPLTNVAAIDCSRTHYLALRTDGTVISWGDPLPTPWTNVIAIAAGESYSAFLLGDGPPRMHAELVQPDLDANGFRVQVAAESGRVYRLEYKDTTADTVWKGLPLVAGRAGMITLRDAAPTSTQRYYRVRRW